MNTRPIYWLHILEGEPTTAPSQHVCRFDRRPDVSTNLKRQYEILSVPHWPIEILNEVNVQSLPSTLSIYIFLPLSEEANINPRSTGQLFSSILTPAGGTPSTVERDCMRHEHGYCCCNWPPRLDRVVTHSLVETAVRAICGRSRPQPQERSI